MSNKHQCMIVEEDLIDQAEYCMQSFIRSFAAARQAERMLDQETAISSAEFLQKYKDDIEQVKFWVGYLLEKNSCSSYTEEP